MTTSSDGAELPLTGVRVLALEHFVALPSGTNILAALGAEVIKIEPVGVGEEGRRSLPVADGKDGYTYGSAFVRYSRGKSSLAVDLKHPEGVELVKSLAARVDVFAENMRAGVADRLGLGAAALRDVNPGLIYASISGFGHHDSPYTSWPAFAPAAEAMAAMPQLAQAGAPSPRPGTFGAIVDLAGGLNAVIGVLAALHGRSRTGRGYEVDISLFDTALALNDHAIQLAAMGQSTDGARTDKNGIVELFNASDGRFIIAVFRPDQFARLARLVGHPEWIDEPRFADRREWSLHLDDPVRPAVETWAASFTAKEAAARMAEAGVVAAPNLEAAQILADDHVRTRMIATVDGLVNDTVIIGSPVRLVGIADRRTELAPVGRDTARLLRNDLGLSTASIEDLVDRAVVSREST